MDNPSAAEAMLIVFFAFALLMIPFVFYVLTLQKTLKAISPENRTMAPSQVWMLFIPLFGIIWHFIVVARISDSIKAESLLRNIELTSARPAYSIGMAMCILNCISILFNRLEILSSVSVLGFIVCWIIYWVKIASYKKQIKNSSVITLDAEAYSPVQ